MFLPTISESYLVRKGGYVISTQGTGSDRKGAPKWSRESSLLLCHSSQRLPRHGSYNKGYCGATRKATSVVEGDFRQFERLYSLLSQSHPIHYSYLNSRRTTCIKFNPWYLDTYILKVSTSGFTRLIVEKPFGHDLASAGMLATALGAIFDEDHIYRYLSLCHATLNDIFIGWLLKRSIYYRYVVTE